MSVSKWHFLTFKIEYINLQVVTLLDFLTGFLSIFNGDELEDHPDVTMQSLQVPVISHHRTANVNREESY